MSYSDYRDPVRFEPPPPRRFPRWAVVLIVVLMLLGGGAYLLYAGPKLFMRSKLKGILPPEGVRTGSPLAWRTLERDTQVSASKSDVVGGVFIADFDGDGDDEVLLVRDAGNSLLLEVDGSRTKQGIGGTEFMMGGVTWDYNRDGTSEIVVETMLGDVQRQAGTGVAPEDIEHSQELPVYYLSGKTAAELPVVALMPNSIFVGDFDGDGGDELLARAPDPDHEYGSNTYLALGRYGKQVWHCRPDEHVGFGCAGDVDGDGRDELVVPVGSMFALEAYGMDQEPQRFGTGIKQGVPTACFDVDGDGVDEVFLGGQHFYNPAARHTVSLVPPPGFSGGFQLNLSAFIAVADVLGDATPEIVVAERYGNGYLLIFEPTGYCVYYEEFGDLLFYVGTAHTASRDYIVIQTTEKLLIYP